MTVSQVVWDEDKRKTRDTCFKIYRDYTGLKAVPRDRQYITMCGAMTLEDGKTPNLNSEYVHGIRCGMFNKTQFYGAEIEVLVQKANQKLFPDVALFEGKIERFLRSLLADEILCPAIVNLDTANFPKESAQLLITCLDLLNYTQGAVTVFWNTCLENQYWASSVADLASELDTPSGRRILRGWKQVTGFKYCRKGARTLMGTFVLNRPDGRRF